MSRSLISGAPRFQSSDFVPSLSEYAPAKFYRILTSPYREAYWTILVRLYSRKFTSATVALSRPEAIDLAEHVLEDLAARGMDLTRLAAEEEWDLPEVEDDTPTDSPMREPGRRIIRVLAGAGWIYFQTYADERYPVVEITVIAQRQIAHMLRDMRGERLPLMSFADRIKDLVGDRCARMHVQSGRLRQLRDVVGQLNERIYELLGSVKHQSEGVLARARTIEGILADLLGAFERHVGSDYSLLKRKESPPLLWSAVTSAIYELRSNSVWLHKETEWYREQFHLQADDARAAVEEDLQWIAQVMDNLSHANDLLDKRYSRYVALANSRVEGRLRQTFNMADGLNALLEAVAAGKAELQPVSVVRVVGIGQLSFTFNRKARESLPDLPVPEVGELTEAEARAHRKAMDDSIPISEVRHWLGGTPDGVPRTVDVDILPLDSDYDYVCHISAAFYALRRGSGLVFQAATCRPDGIPCDRDDCEVCRRHGETYSVPRGRYVISPPPAEVA